MKSALEIMLEAAYDEGCKNGKKEAEVELTSTKRALWLARAERAWAEYCSGGDDDSLWRRVHRRCRPYALKKF